MAYTDDAVKAKLSALNETQEGIVTVAQWVMFHRRHAERTAQLWLQKLRDSPAPKRLNLIYLANEVAQQSRARRKEDFLIAFSPIIAEATAIAYKGSSNDIQQKLRRVVEVWRQRSIFELPIQEAVEARVDEIDKSRSTGKKPLLGGSLFSSSSGSTPSELQPLVPLQVAVSKATVASTASATAANAEYDKMHDPSTPLPTPPVHAARLSQLLKALANAESSVSEVIKSRIALIEGLEKLLETNRSALSKEQSIVAQLTERKSETEATKREVEDGIMRGLSAENSPAVNHGDAGPEGEPISRPEVEALTPPPVEAITPVGSPKQAAQESDFSAVPPQPQILGGFTLPGFGNPADSSLSAAGFPPVGLGEHQTDGSNGLHAKRRKVTHEEEDYAQFAGGDLDADVAELLKQEGDAQQ
ncbi:regulation of nuclear pre-mRNA domain containing protein 1B [Aspergillus niger]|uniref:RNA polymerase II-binding domain-domain-containing protein n=2 Tax=Aspergillus subgen. Circumdati TaxID=2720871 RepID=A0A3F3Q410_9EURO|nr:RNA polymerase II-binding domain-domain-containing protein [Aspergillus welwitschiae]GKZ56916.1 regulation of nuclear pre-mRNA domain containing protein 1B [Aspergillus niger]RDH33426.1 RNA polymerase II-binding domain-domain-containing protein [Aspergillus welwitschiae]GKZ71411.1 regulation of nuclear pre-mRNA domain containing protein 1B [Aspergillus niger]GKZ82637.1 regulation of nuclear pre-mRNA domain containing protein 1B [Aspergillus niger]GLA06944.1 regulation of nuclear pre-mRNA do